MAPFETCRVAAHDRSLTIRIGGALRASAEQVLRTTLSVAALRYVVEPVAREGDAVRPGDRIARLVSPHADVRAAQARAMLHLLEAQLLDAQSAALGQADEASRLEVRAAEKRVEQARADVEACQRVAAGVELRSAIEGVLTVADAGASPSDAAGAVTVGRVVCLDPLRFEAALPPGVGAPSAGEACEVSAGSVRRAGTSRGSAPLATHDGLAVLVVEVPNADRAFAAGQRAELTFRASVRRASFVPASAVVPEPGALWVWVEGPRGLEARKVSALSGLDGPEIAVTGVIEGELVVRDAAAFLRAGGARVGAPLGDEGSEND